MVGERDAIISILSVFFENVNFYLCTLYLITETAFSALSRHLEKKIKVLINHLLKLRAN